MKHLKLAAIEFKIIGLSDDTILEFLDNKNSIFLMEL